MKQEAQSVRIVWVAVKVVRGYISDAKLFTSSASAYKTVRRWRKTLNPDYDEADVVESVLPQSMKPGSQL